jgi:hypothetical protein
MRNKETNPNCKFFLTERDSLWQMSVICLFILGLPVRAIEGGVTRINEAAVSTGLVIKQSKTKYVQVTRNITNVEQVLKMDGEVFKGVQNSSCLGALITQAIHVFIVQDKCFGLEP